MELRTQCSSRPCAKRTQEEFQGETIFAAASTPPPRNCYGSIPQVRRPSHVTIIKAPQNTQAAPLSGADHKAPFPFVATTD